MATVKLSMALLVNPVTQEPLTYVKIEDDNLGEIAVVEANPETVAETLENKC
jgi:hypothetical protein